MESCQIKLKVGQQPGTHFYYMRHCHFVRLAPPAPVEGSAQILLVGPVQRDLLSFFLSPGVSLSFGQSLSCSCRGREGRDRRVTTGICFVGGIDQMLD